MLLTEYNEAETMELFKEEGREEGRKEGRKEGEKRAQKHFLAKLIDIGWDPHEAANFVGVSV